MPVDTQGLRFSVLGPVRARRGGDEIRLGPAQQRALLALLLTQAGQQVSLRECVDVLWPHDPPESAVNVVYRYVGVLRRLLEPELPKRAPGRWLVREGGGYRLAAATGDVDLLAFRDLVARARGAVADAEETAVGMFVRALELRTGPVAAGIPEEVRVHPVFAEVDREYLAVVKEAADVALAHCAAGEVLAVLHRNAVLYPLDEPLQARLVLALAATGHRAEALQSWQTVRVRLADELGIAPGPELRAAQEHVLRGPATTTESSADPDEMPVALGRRTESHRPSLLVSRPPRVLAVTGPTAHGLAPVQGDGPTAPEPFADRAVPVGRRSDRCAPLPEPTDGSRDHPSAADDEPQPRGREASADFPAGARPRQLPVDLPVFAGRQADLERVLALYPMGGPPPGTVVIGTIGGMAGIGKTTLAVHWAHRVAHRFPDGQLYVDLRGFDPVGTVMDPGTALRGFLEALGVPPHHIPADPDAQAARYRSLLTGRRLLILLDNARDAEQVRPLLPAAPGCLVVVTSRDGLAGLAATDGARPLSLAPLSEAEAHGFLSRRLGPARVAAEPHAAAEIITRCAGLPLALAVVAARAATHPAFRLTAIAAELRAARDSLDAFADPDPADDIRAVFSCSYAALSPEAARLFRLLALHPGPDIGRSAAAGLAATDVRAVRRLLAELTRAHLLTEHAPGRYTCHDLLRTYAAELTDAHEPAAERRAAVARMTDHYLHTARAAHELLAPWWTPPALPVPYPVESRRTFADDRQALHWFTAEHAVLRAVLEQAARAGLDTRTWQLAWLLERFLDVQGHWHDFAAVQRIGLAAAARTGDMGAQAHLHRALARASGRIERYDDALTHIRLSLDLFGELDDVLGLAHAHRSHGWLLDRLGRHDEALDHARQALSGYRAAEADVAATSALHALGQSHALSGNHARAVAYFEEALAGLEGLGNRYGEANTWDSLGHAHHQLGDHDRAVAAYQQALDRYREVGDHYSEAGTLTRLGDTHLAGGDATAARTAWDSALTLLADAHPLAAGPIRGRLDALTPPAEPGRPAVHRR